MAMVEHEHCPAPGRRGGRLLDRHAVPGQDDRRDSVSLGG
jgi:hypothetical protein